MSAGNNWTPLEAKVASAERWAREPDRAAATAPGRKAARARFYRLVDPEGVLSPEERHERAMRAERAHMLRMAQASVEARAAKRAKGGGRTS